LLQQFGRNPSASSSAPSWPSGHHLAGTRSGHLLDDLKIFKACDPHYAIQLLTTYPRFWLLEPSPLRTTGAEALYSDLGHCGKGNIRISWI